ncbi:ArsR/SmtB family transcription factor [Pseudodesulfovibrio tunisiensis]|uniref:ArsR/SmtB family transcription factor n=1 Tax=Pseudodesulfovibrio tunisiensis TaxID=463192 RepID=UPI001FB2C8AA|nr:metalloregulator ArsR/SmtB family transcription factor [Pseudodesulfovibrio tunisiensis]
MKTLNTRERNSARAEVFKALGHPARMVMVDALCRDEMCVCDLRDLVDLDMSTVSKHLSVLKNAGVVASRKQGNWAWYRLEMPCVIKFLECLDATLDKRVRPAEDGI